MSGECSEIMNCNLQRYINNNNWTKHVMIFLSIYIFTFILNWYTFDSLIFENFKNQKSKEEEKMDYLTKSLYYSVVIYLVFILSTKNEGLYLFSFLMISILIVLGTIYTKSINSSIYGEFRNNFMISESDRKKTLKKYKNNKSDVNKIVLYQNIMSSGFVAIMSILCLGSYQYYLKQSKDHSKKWSWLIFWFGYNKQCGN